MRRKAAREQGGGKQDQRRHRNVSRVDRYGQHGWVVKVTRRGVRFREYFTDRGEGGGEGALRRALRRRDELESALPPPVKIKRHYPLNSTGVVGVVLEKWRTATGYLMRYYTAQWTELTGQKKRARFL